MESYNTLIEAIEGYKAQGYTIDFNLKKNFIECMDGKYQLYPGDFSVDKFYRFEANTDPSEQAIIYAISSPNNQIKGILVNAYGIYSDDLATELREALTIHKNE